MKPARAPTATTTNDATSELVKGRLAELRTLHDTIRLELNLAGKEARDRWLRLQARMRATGTRARGARNRRTRGLAKLVKDVRRFRNHLLEKAAPISRIC